MKKNIIIFLSGGFLAILLAFKAAEYTPTNATAEVINIEGFYIFTDSRPVKPYDSLGIVNLGLATDTQYESVRSNLVKRARKTPPHADGLILKLNRKGIDKCVVVKFK
ncbi:MAG: hypothetical protein HYZ42_03705 [Bacteroidetes bacterium]|nr:hypothetical protein [Bacteroidota bacterium]